MSAFDEPVPASGLRLAWSSAETHGTGVLNVVGELDDFTVGLFEAKVAQLPEHYRRLVIDLTWCSFVSSAGLHGLMRASAALKHDRLLAVVTPHRHLVKVFEIAGLGPTILTYPTLAAAMARTRTTGSPHLRLVPVVGDGASSPVTRSQGGG